MPLYNFLQAFTCFHMLYKLSSSQDLVVGLVFKKQTPQTYSLVWKKFELILKNQIRVEYIVSPQKKVAYCKVPKVGTNSWGSFFARAGAIELNSRETPHWRALLVLGGVRKFEKFFKVKIGNKTLDEVRRKYQVNGMNSIAEVMPLIGRYTGWGILTRCNFVIYLYQHYNLLG